MSSRHSGRWQFIRFLVVGVASNVLLFSLYLLLTWSGMGPKTAMTGLYVLGVLQTFTMNQSFTFRTQGRVSHRLLRYTALYAGGYVLNLLALLLFVDRWQQRHEVVQAAMVLVVALLMFLLMKYWVFTPVTTDQPK